MHTCNSTLFKLVTSIDQIDPSNPYTNKLISDLSYPCSFLGAASIIVSALYKRRVLSPRVHPIFVFSIADIMLSMLWIAGSALWLFRHSSMRRGWCFVASLMTVVSAHSPQIALINVIIAFSASYILSWYLSGWFVFKFWWSREFFECHSTLWWPKRPGVSIV